MTSIKFGTSGWRAIIAEDFTFHNVKVVAQAIADYLQHAGESQQGVVVGYDERFMSGDFAETAACVLAKNRIPVYLTDRSCPTPTISYETIRRKAAGAINITASHNPPEYGGIKYSPGWGGPAPTEITSEIERRANRLIERNVTPEIVDPEDARSDGRIKVIDPAPDYFARLRELVDFDAIRRAAPVVVADTMYGAGRGYLDALLQEAGCELTVLHSEPNPGFGKLHSSEPADENIKELIETIHTKQAIAGLAVDGDADRFGIVDSNGVLINPNFIIGLLLDYLVRSRGWKGETIRTVPSSHFIDAVAQKHGVNVFVTPVGFKYIATRMLELPDDFIIGGEESGGLTMRGHVPEKDGILACLLTLEMLVKEGKSLTELMNGLYEEVGSFLYERRGVRVTDERKQWLLNLKELPNEMLGYQVTGTVMPQQIPGWDGYKALLAEPESGRLAWYAFRMSGTEPMARCYVEADSDEEAQRLADAAVGFISGEGDSIS